MSSTQPIVHEIEVPGPPERVWPAVATGPGITAWFVPATLDGRPGGTIAFDFGPGLGSVESTLTDWEPPTRFAYLGHGAAGTSVTFEWRVVPRANDTCLVQLETSGFQSAADRQTESDATGPGWRLFLDTLRLYLTHFAGQLCTSMLVQQLTTATPDATWRQLTDSLGLPAAPHVGQDVAVSVGPPLRGRVERFQSRMLTVLLEAPAPGVAVIGAESFAEQGFPMVYLYLFGPGAAEAIQAAEPAWQSWIERTFEPPPTEPPTDPA
jgi:uncharacterized protein YndB with AHSA1/START domain